MSGKILYPRLRPGREYDRLRVCTRCGIAEWFTKSAIALGKYYHKCGAFMRRATIAEHREGIVALSRQSLGTIYQSVETEPEEKVILQIIEDKVESRVVREPTQEEIRRVLLGKHYKP